MPDARSKNTAFVLGTSHEYQRHQDNVDASEQLRAKLEKRIRDIISEKKIELITEEAGDDKDVWSALKEQEKEDFELLGALLEGTEIVSEPVQTIAKLVVSWFSLKWRSDVLR